MEEAFLLYLYLIWRGENVPFVLGRLLACVACHHLSEKNPNPFYRKNEKFLLFLLLLPPHLVSAFNDDRPFLYSFCIW